ncbi:ATP-binding protein, partial [Oenococcus oeni]
GGTGLGLSIAKWIVNAFQGKISVSDNSPKGTIFKVVLPQLKLNK